jgi:DNA-3-methyladenine glycosylase II
VPKSKTSAPAPGATDNPAVPSYWDDACKHLAQARPRDEKAHPEVRRSAPASRGDAFTTLARSIVGQQISVKAAQSVWDRFAAAVGGPSHRLAPDAVLVLSVPAARGRPVGPQGRVPGRPGAALSNPAGARGQLAGRWTTRPSSTELVAIRGIGRWTAEMFLIFHLMRPNVLPLDDLGLIKGISVNYFSGEPVSRAEAREVGDAWAPLPLGGHLVHLAQPRPAAGRLLTARVLP